MWRHGVNDSTKQDTATGARSTLSVVCWDPGSVPPNWGNA